MERVVKVFFSPLMFAIGFLWPLTVQVFQATELVSGVTGWQVWTISALIVLPFALMAQFRGSWIWIK